MSPIINARRDLDRELISIPSISKFRGQYQIAGFFSLIKPTLLVLDPAVVRQIFLTDFNKFNDNGFDAINKEIDPILGRNPFFLNGDEWKERRAEVTPAFTASRVSNDKKSFFLIGIALNQVLMLIS